MFYQVIKDGKILNAGDNPTDFIDGGYAGSSRSDCLLLTTNRQEAVAFSENLDKQLAGRRSGKTRR